MGVGDVVGGDALLNFSALGNFDGQLQFVAHEVGMSLCQ